jgi:sugar-specific transcriptional regulator TrmB
MDTTRTAIRSYFTKLGLGTEIADIYLALHAHGPQSISALARNAQVERTRVYRLIDQLMDSNLIELEAGNKRGVIKAAPIANLRILINRREEELKGLHDELGMVEQILARNSLSDPVSHLQLYRGPEGVRQLLTNQLEAQSELLSYAFRDFEAELGKKFMAGWQSDATERHINQRLLSNRLESLNNHTIACRFIDEAVFRITFACAVYNDIVAHCYWRGDEIFGLEIRNPAFADSQRQLFEMLWAQAKPSRL